MLSLPICCNRMGSRPAERAWPNTAASSWTAGERINGGDSAASFYLPRRRLCHQPRQSRKPAVRWMNPVHFKIIRVDHVLPASGCWMAPLPVKKALARRRERFPCPDQRLRICVCAFVTPPGFRLAVPPRYHSRPDDQTEACSSHPLSGKWPVVVHRHPPFFINDRDTSRVNP